MKFPSAYISNINKTDIPQININQRKHFCPMSILLYALFSQTFAFSIQEHGNLNKNKGED